jgi:hypothetical protein
MLKKIIKKLVFFIRIRYTAINIPVTPLDLRVNAHFGRVFSFL